MSIKRLIGLAVAATVLSTQVHAKTEIEWWHAPILPHFL